MQQVCRRILGIALAALLAAAVGCKSETETPSKGGKRPAASSHAGGKSTDGGITRPAAVKTPDEKTTLNDALAEVETPPPAAIPEVKLTAGMQADCLVAVGDAMPQGDLRDLDSKTATFASLKGKKATVVFFWDDGENMTARMLAVTALEDIQRDIFTPYGDKGLAVMAVDVRDTPEDIRKVVTESDAKFPVLSDEKGEYFAKVVKDGKVPRVYLLDASGKIVWFDVEFSRTTRRDLKQAVAFVLKDQ